MTTTPLIEALDAALGHPFGVNPVHPASTINPAAPATRAIQSSFHQIDAPLSAADLTTVLATQLRQRDPRETEGRFGPAGWLLEAGVVPLVLDAVSSLPTFPRDTIRFSELTRGACRALLERLPAALLDSVAACGPTTRTLAAAGARHREVRPIGYVVGPDRIDERLMLDGVLIATDQDGPLCPDVIVDLLAAHDWESLNLTDHVQHLLSAPWNPATPAALLCHHTTVALRALWPVAERRFGLTGAAHPPDEINLVRTGSSFAVRFWWRWGGDETGCPSKGGRPTAMTTRELARHLA
ncbi:hypothetical protein [Salana multivorans]